MNNPWRGITELVVACTLAVILIAGVATILPVHPPKPAPNPDPVPTQSPDDHWAETNAEFNRLTDLNAHLGQAIDKLSESVDRDKSEMDQVSQKLLDAINSIPKCKSECSPSKRQVIVITPAAHPMQPSDPVIWDNVKGSHP